MNGSPWETLDEDDEQLLRSIINKKLASKQGQHARKRTSKKPRSQTRSRHSPLTLSSSVSLLQTEASKPPYASTNDLFVQKEGDKFFLVCVPLLRRRNKRSSVVSLGTSKLNAHAVIRNHLTSCKDYVGHRTHAEPRDDLPSKRRHDGDRVDVRRRKHRRHGEPGDEVLQLGSGVCDNVHRYHDRGDHEDEEADDGDDEDDDLGDEDGDDLDGEADADAQLHHGGDERQRVAADYYARFVGAFKKQVYQRAKRQDAQVMEQYQMRVRRLGKEEADEDDDDPVAMDPERPQPSANGRIRDSIMFIADNQHSSRPMRFGDGIPFHTRVPHRRAIGDPWPAITVRCEICSGASVFEHAICDGSGHHMPPATLAKHAIAHALGGRHQERMHRSSLFDFLPAGTTYRRTHAPARELSRLPSSRVVQPLPPDAVEMQKRIVQLSEENDSLSRRLNMVEATVNAVGPRSCTSVPFNSSLLKHGWWAGPERQLALQTLAARSAVVKTTYDGQDEVILFASHVLVFSGCERTCAGGTRMCVACQTVPSLPAVRQLVRREVEQIRQLECFGAGGEQLPSAAQAAQQLAALHPDPCTPLQWWPRPQLEQRVRVLADLERRHRAEVVKLHRELARREVQHAALRQLDDPRDAAVALGALRADIDLLLEAVHRTHVELDASVLEEMQQRIRNMAQVDSHQHRYLAQQKDIAAAIYCLSGSKLLSVIGTPQGLPSRSTVQRHVNDLVPGLDVFDGEDSLAQAVAGVLENLVFDGPVLCVLATDETELDARIELCYQGAGHRGAGRARLLGICPHDADGTCLCGTVPAPTLQDLFAACDTDEEKLAALTEAVSEARVAKQLSAVMLSIPSRAYHRSDPEKKRFVVPSLPLYIFGTCGSFTGKHANTVNDKAIELCVSTVMPVLPSGSKVVSHSSDGLAARRLPMLYQSCTTMPGSSVLGPLDQHGGDELDVSIPYTCFQVTGKQLRTNQLAEPVDVIFSGLMDTFHNGKKMYNGLFRKTGLSTGHVQFDLRTLESATSFLRSSGADPSFIPTKEELARPKYMRMDVRSMLKMFSPVFIDAVLRVGDRIEESGDDESAEALYAEHYTAMAWFLTVGQQLIDAIYSPVSSLEQRVRQLGYVVASLLEWRSALLDSPVSLRDGFVSRPCLLDVLLLCQHVLLLLRYLAENSSAVVVELDLLHRLSSDAVEVFWSLLGGWVVNKRCYRPVDVSEIVRKAMVLELLYTREHVCRPEAAKRGTVWSRLLARVRRRYAAGSLRTVGDVVLDVAGVEDQAVRTVHVGGVNSCVSRADLDQAWRAGIAAAAGPFSDAFGGRRFKLESYDVAKLRCALSLRPYEDRDAAKDVRPVRGGGLVVDAADEEDDGQSQEDDEPAEELDAVDEPSLAARGDAELDAMYALFGHEQLLDDGEEEVPHPRDQGPRDHEQLYIRIGSQRTHLVTVVKGLWQSHRAFLSRPSSDRTMRVMRRREAGRGVEHAALRQLMDPRAGAGGTAVLKVGLYVCSVWDLAVHAAGADANEDVPAEWVLHVCHIGRVRERRRGRGQRWTRLTGDRVRYLPLAVSATGERLLEVEVSGAWFKCVLPEHHAAAPVPARGHARHAVFDELDEDASFYSSDTIVSNVIVGEVLRYVEPGTEDDTHLTGRQLSMPMSTYTTVYENAIKFAKANLRE